MLLLQRNVLLNLSIVLTIILALKNAKHLLNQNFKAVRDRKNQHALMFKCHHISSAIGIFHLINANLKITVNSIRIINTCAKTITIAIMIIIHANQNCAKIYTLKNNVYL